MAVPGPRRALKRGSIVVFAVAAVAAVVLAVSAVSFADLALERWYLWRLGSPDEAVRVAAVGKLGRFGRPGVVPYVLRAAQEDTATVRLAAIHALGQRLKECPEVIPHFARFAVPLDEGPIAKAALQALTGAGPAAVDPLLDAFHELSGGMKQRVALARALAPNPHILLMDDEPFASLDAMTREQFYGDLQEIWQKKKRTILFVTHNVREAVCLGDRVFLFSARPGRIRELFLIGYARPRDLDNIEVARRAAEIRTALRKHLGTEAEIRP